MSSQTTFIRPCLSTLSAANTPGFCSNTGDTGAPGDKWSPPKPTGPSQPGRGGCMASQTTFIRPCLSTLSAANTPGLCSNTGDTGAPGDKWSPPKPTGPCQPGLGWFMSSQTTFIRPCLSTVSAANTPGFCSNTGDTGAPGDKWSPPKSTGPCQPGLGWFMSSQTTFIRPCLSTLSAANTPGFCSNTGDTGAPGDKWSPPKPTGPSQPGRGGCMASQTTFIRPCLSTLSAANTPGLCSNTGDTGAPGDKWSPPKPTGPCQPGLGWFMSSQTTFIRPCLSTVSAANTPGFCSNTGDTGAPGDKWSPPKPTGPCQPGLGWFMSSQTTFIRPCLSTVGAANTPGFCSNTGDTGAPGDKWSPPKPTGPCQPGLGWFMSSQTTFIRPCLS